MSHGAPSPIDDTEMERSLPTEMEFRSISVTWQSDIASRRFSYAGPQAARLLGFPTAAWYDEGFWEGRIAVDDRAQVVEQRRIDLDRGTDIDAVYRMVTSTGTHVLVREVATVVESVGGGKVLRGLFLAIGDSLSISEMPASVKAFASFAGHELSQPVGAVLANAEAMQRLLEADPPRVAEAINALKDVIASARHTARLISGMRQGAR